jgi:hypothetical protein
VAAFRELRADVHASLDGSFNEMDQMDGHLDGLIGAI